MMDQAASGERVSPLAQMTARRRAAQRVEEESLLQAIRVAFGRMAQDVRGFDALVRTVSLRHGALVEVLELSEPGMFVLLMEGQGDRMGVAIACPDLLSGMVEALTTGHLLPAAPPPRKPTRTDAALVEPLIDSFLKRIVPRLEGKPIQADFMGYVMGSFLADPRPLGLVLEDVGFTILQLELGLGGSGRQGRLCLAVPSQPRHAPDPAQEDPAATRRAWSARLEAAVAVSKVQLDAVLYRMKMPLSDLAALRLGDRIGIPETALETLSLETLDGRPVAQARLGQARGQRALRLTGTPGTAPELQLLPAARAMVLPAPPSPVEPPVEAERTDIEAYDMRMQGAEGKAQVSD